MIYLDNNATAPIKPAVCAAVMEAMARTGNPSSVHRHGRVARKHVEEARAKVAAMAGVDTAQIIFTSGGTEANNLALRGIKASLTFVSSIEHESVLGFADRILPVTTDGIVDCAAAENLFKTAPHGSLVSVMLVNNETGIIQPVAALAKLAKLYGHKIHCDAVQAAGRLPLNFKDLGVDALTLSAHKIGGPQGIGALVVSKPLVLKSQLRGGGQEMNRRGGTENVSGIIGFGVAAQLAADDLREMVRLQQWRNELQDYLEREAGEDAVVVGKNTDRVANTLCIAMRGIRSETQVMAMDIAGVAVSAGSACSSGKVKTSHVLNAMGYDNAIAASAMRISLGWNTQYTDIQRCAEAWISFYHRAHNAQQSAAA